jgi:MtrB/PioB family decaheme-associated outer membrane protein
METKTTRNLMASAIVLLSLLAPSVFAQAPDTSEWACEFCPFDKGHTAENQIGASYVSDDSVFFGDAMGYGEKGGYLNLDGTGRYAGDTFVAKWVAEDLGLDSRYAELVGGRPGSYDFNVSWRQIPRLRYNSTSTVFVQSGSSNLTLPSGWVQAPVTSGFTALDSSLVRRAIEGERSILDVGGRYLVSNRFSFSANYRRQEYDGLRIKGGPTFTNASLLPMPFDNVTDIVDLGIRYRRDNAFVSLGWYLSEFESGHNSVSWQQPFSFSPPLGTDTLSLAQAPDSRYQQLMLAGGYSFPDYRTVINASVAFGQHDQDTAFLPYTSNPDLMPGDLPSASLNGDVETTNMAFVLTSRPGKKSRVKFSYRYDERDSKTAQYEFERVIVDSVLSGDPQSNTPYSFERGKLQISADYDLLDKVRVSGGYDRIDHDRDFQEVASQTEDTGWGRVRWRALDSVEIDIGGGVSNRDIDGYNEVFALTLGQNPLMRKYNLAYRYRRFGDLRFEWSSGNMPISVAVSGRFAEDDYTQSRQGITSGDELAISGDLSWSITRGTSIYVNAGVEQLKSEQSASEQFGDADWGASHDDDFTTLGAGFRIREISDNVDLQLDYTRSDGASNIRLDSARAGVDPFPTLNSVLDYLRFRLEYRRSEKLAFNVSVRYQRVKSDDWSLQGVGPATIPVVLSLGAAPYNDEAVIAGISVSYRIGKENK